MPSVTQIPVQIRFGDIDSYGHANNVVYIQYLEDARVQLTHAPMPQLDDADPGDGATFQQLISDDQFTLVGRQEIEYLAPLEFRPAPVYVNIWVTNVGGSSYEFGYSVAEKDGTVTYALASTTMVLVSRTTGRPVRLSEAQRRALSAWLGGPVPFRRHNRASSSTMEGTNA